MRFWKITKWATFWKSIFRTKPNFEQNNVLRRYFSHWSNQHTYDDAIERHLLTFYYWICNIFENFREIFEFLSFFKFCIYGPTIDKMSKNSTEFQMLCTCLKNKIDYGSFWSLKVLIWATSKCPLVLGHPVCFWLT